MNKYLLYTIIGVVIIVLGLGTYYLLRNNNTQNGSTPTTKADNTITINNFAFNPDNLQVKKGTKVTWKNEDSVTHKIKSDNFNSGDLGNGDTYVFTFENTGVFDYSCSIHPTMKGKVTVE